MEKTKGYCTDHLAFVGVARRRRLHVKGSVFTFAPTLSFTKHLRNGMRKEEGNSSNKSNKRTQTILSQALKH
jgi:hypothetical protein